MPAEPPVATPVDETTDATVELLLLHVPPPLFTKTAVAFTQTGVLPVMAPGSGLTITDRVLIQPVPKVYVMMVVPGATLVTTPEPEERIVAIDVLLLLQEPPAVVLLNEVVRPMQTAGVPVIFAGKGLTTTDVVIKQPVFIP